ncbi:SRPBCC family protein [Prauserella endophytica]|uniref:SRPBCC family protein n=1 Tax=Prauserella endophytica TaxID=1592324 RepID=A0ABY2S8V9_9PSEU|nr:SRPBCC family protein [Prauserella endophytica]TKG72338.1 SRPBCC family protein [Prauserella endophytica]
MRPVDRAPLDDLKGTIGLGPDGAWQIRFERRLRHSPERVWQALVDPDEQGRWLPGVTIDARVGGVAVYDFGEEGRAEGTVRAVEPPSVLEHSWSWPGEEDSVVRWELRAEDDATVLVLLHRPVRPEPAVHYCLGWHVMLDALDAHLGGGEPAEPDYDHLASLYA